MLSKSKEVKLKELTNKLEENAAKLSLAKNPKDIVPPEGNPNAEIMFIGEAAGYQEELQRRPFVGPAGKLLNSVLQAIKIRRQEVWISNILKVRPPQNRDPLPEEIDAFKPYLDREIEIINPKIIVTLGRFSMAKFIPSAYISRIHGQARWVDWQGKRFLILPMYHPAAALRNPQVMHDFKEDFAKIPQLLTSLKNLNNGNYDATTTEIDTTKQGKNQQLQLI